MPITSKIPTKTEYDIIVCGGGAAACVLVGRIIAAAPNLSILVIESGVNNYNYPSIITPGKLLSNYAPDSGLLDYYVGEKSEHVLGREVVVPTGRVLGGGSSVNVMMYTRGSESDYDDWGMKGWAAKDLIPLLRKSENYQHIYDTKPDRKVHGFYGPLEVSQGGGTNIASAEEYLETVEKLGFPITGDVQDLKTVNAFQRWPKWISPKTGRRQDAAHGFLHPYVSNVNLTVLCEHSVVRVLIDDDTATGVEVVPSSSNPSATPNPTPIVFTARRKIVLSAGGLGSPQILERSGLGDPAILEKVGVECLVPLPGVGAAYQDHPLLQIVNRFDESLAVFGPYCSGDPIITAKADEDFLQGKGDHTANFVDAGGKVRPTAEEVASMGPEFAEVWERVYKDKADKPLLVSFFLSTLFSPIPNLTPGYSYASSLMFLCHPASRGSIHITSPTLPAATTPHFTPGFFSHPADIPPYIWGYKAAREITRRMPSFRGEVLLAHPAFPADSPARCIEVLPAGGVEELARQGIAMYDIPYTKADDEAIEKFVRGAAGTTFHSMATCPMKKRREGGVVNKRLNVYGVDNLMVADMSICPSNVASNTYSTALMIGEKAAVLLAQELHIEIL
ncbi:GMC oxidoreductase-domain-containing protein [Peziza echinospora]|nr:GMC oxidoreductase-domain-containing protein [Peziza echinospora]